MSEISYLQPDEFEAKVLQADGPVLVDFFAEWCYPCRVQLSYLEQLATQDDSPSIVRINVDDFPKIAREFEVESIPSLILFRQGTAGELQRGTTNEKKLRGLLKAKGSR